MYNSASTEFDTTYQVNCVVHSNGWINFIPPGIFISTCKVRLLFQNGQLTSNKMVPSSAISFCFFSVTSDMAKIKISKKFQAITACPKVIFPLLSFYNYLAPWKKIHSKYVWHMLEHFSLPPVVLGRREGRMAELWVFKVAQSPLGTRKCWFSSCQRLNTCHKTDHTTKRLWKIGPANGISSLSFRLKSVGLLKDVSQCLLIYCCNTFEKRLFHIFWGSNCIRGCQNEAFACT